MGNSESESSEPVSEETYTKSTIERSQEMSSGEQKILGVRWNVSADRLVFNLEDIVCQVKDLKPTKRNVISIVGKFYDPLGFMAPIIIRFNMFFQELCEAKVNWDETLSGPILIKWQSLVQDLQTSQSISIPRCYFDGIHDEVELYKLYGFCDASTGAYAAVIYLLMKTRTDHVVKFIASKTRVAPSRSQTIPRLELLSALLLAKLIVSITHALKSELPLSSPTCFTDSTVALFWIRGQDKEWKPFVQNRVNEIRKLTSIDCWNHCPGKDNPADVPSRGLSPLELSINVLWRNGPAWLGDVGVNEKSQLSMPEECATEMKAKDRNLILSLLVTNAPPSVGRDHEM